MSILRFEADRELKFLELKNILITDFLTNPQKITF
ncbi:hypothetical protein X738_31775 [Mesorhizobium sp. LNHC209A00]|nr:hypothetical protein X738_31775 [Mesorhizobium sp. LNHC209A00]